MITVTPPIIPYDCNFSAGVKGEYLPYIVNPDGTEEYPLGKEFMPNIITNIGIDRWFTNTGFGGTGFLFSDNTFLPSINWCRVGSGTNAASASDTALQTQLTDPAPTTTNFTGSGGCLSVLTDATTLGTVTHKITKQFNPVTAGPVSINEIGLGWAATTASTLFSRFVTPSTITLQTNQQLRVVYQLTISLPQYITVSSITGLSNNGFSMTGTATAKGLRLVHTPQFLFGELNSSGVFNNIDPGNGFIWNQIGADAPAIPFNRFESGGPWLLTSSSPSFPAVGANPSGWTFSGDSSAFVSSTYTGAGAGNNTKFKDRIYEWTISNPVNTVSTINGIKHGALTMLFDNPQTKTNEHRLRLTLRSSWVRI